MLDWTPEAVRTWNLTKEGNVRNTHQKHYGISFSIPLITPVRVYDLQLADCNVLANAPLQLDVAKLRKLRPVFKDVGSVTAGNSSSIGYNHLLDYLFPLPLSLTLFMFFQSTN